MSLRNVGVLCALALGSALAVGCGSRKTEVEIEQAPASEPAPATEAAPEMPSFEVQIREALNKSPSLDSSQIQVRVDGKRVFLTGTVKTEEERQRAHDAAQGVAEVSSVDISELKLQ